MNGIPQLLDGFGRRITCLRLSLTHRCDFRCTYCMSEKMEFMPRSKILSLEECLLIAKVFVASGVSKIRLTGGEPLVKKNMLRLAERIRKLDGLRELTLTANGSQLSKMATPLAQAGIDRINISLDSLDPESFSRITRTGNLHQVLSGIDAAITALGSRRIKIGALPAIRPASVSFRPTPVTFVRTATACVSRPQENCFPAWATRTGWIYWARLARATKQPCAVSFCKPSLSSLTGTSLTCLRTSPASYASCRIPAVDEIDPYLPVPFFGFQGCI